MAKRLWSTLSTGTKARYKRYGVSPQQYNAGKISPEFRKTITGHGGESFAVQRAKQAGLEQIVPGFSTRSKREKEKAAEAYLLGNTHKNRPLIPGPNGTFELEQLDVNGKPLLNKDIMTAKMDFQDWLDKIGHGDMSGEDYKALKAAYTASFTKSKRHR